MKTPQFCHLDTMGDANNSKLCILYNFVDGIDAESWRSHTGDPLSSVYPPDARIVLTGEERGIKLSSLVGNTRSMLVVSKDLKDIIAEQVTERTEYLPVSIIDPRRRPLGKDYFIVNPLGAIDCIDLKRSKVLYSKKNPTKVIEVSDFVLDPKKLEDAPQLFRPEHARAEYIVGPILAKAIRGRKDITNVHWEELPFGNGD
jgi:hypothetical protein